MCHLKPILQVGQKNDAFSLYDCELLITTFFSKELVLWKTVKTQFCQVTGRKISETSLILNVLQNFICLFWLFLELFLP